MASSYDSRPSVLIIAYYFPPENTSGAARPARFHKYLSRFGYDPHVITSSDQDPDSPQANVHYLPGIRTIDKRTLQGLTEGFLRKYFLSHCENVTWIHPSVDLAGRVAPPEGFRAIISTSPPATPHLVAMWLKRRLGIPWIADFRDPIVGNPFLNPGAWHKQVDEKMEPLIFRQADLVIANTENVADSWRRRYPQFDAKIRVLWNGFDPEEDISPAPLPPRTYRTLLHTGSLYGKRHPIPLLESVDRLIERGLVQPSALKIQLLGDVDDASMPRRFHSFRCVADHHCLEWGAMLSRRGALQRLAEADYQLLVDVQDPNAGLQAPAKLFDYLRIGRPVLSLTTRGSAADQILARSGIPHTSVYVDDPPESVDEKMTAFLGMSTEPVKASRWFYEHFDGIEQTRTLAEFIDSL
jgi:glycosyltransferase involved in cell wall biosynthesis